MRLPRRSKWIVLLALTAGCVRSGKDAGHMTARPDGAAAPCAVSPSCRRFEAACSGRSRADPAVQVCIETLRVVRSESACAGIAAGCEEQCARAPGADAGSWGRAACEAGARDAAGDAGSG